MRGLFRRGAVEVDLDGRSVSLAGEQIRMSALEFHLLAYFVENEGIALSRDQLLDNVWGPGYVGLDPERVDLMVRRLRKKLGWQQAIATVPSWGYRLERLPGDSGPELQIVGERP